VVEVDLNQGHEDLNINQLSQLCNHNSLQFFSTTNKNSHDDYSGKSLLNYQP
jgi:hypothetical protein